MLLERKEERNENPRVLWKATSLVDIATSPGSMSLSDFPKAFAFPQECLIIIWKTVRERYACGALFGVSQLSGVMSPVPEEGC